MADDSSSPLPSRVIPVPPARRVPGLIAAVALLVGLAGSVREVTVAAPVGGAIAMLAGFVLALALAFAVLMVGGAEQLRRIEVGVLVAGVVLYLAEHVTAVLPNYQHGDDETNLGRGALRALMHLHDPYPLHFSDVLQHAGQTPLLGGGVVTRYPYPPLTLELGWLLSHVWHPLGQPYVIATLAVAALAVVVFAALPREYRVLAVTLVFGLGLFDIYAANGYPSVVALPLLALAATGWTSIGAGGRLRRRGVLQAFALGAAASCHQLAWIVALLLILSVWIVRRGELGPRAALLTVARFTGVAVLVFVVLNAPFLAADPHAWFTALTTVLTQHVLPIGVGLVSLTVSVVGHSGGLAYYSYATIALAVAVVGFVVVGFRRVALAVPVFMGVLFLLSTRSSVDYLILFAPLWVVWAVTTDTAAVAASRPVALPSGRALLTSSLRRWAAVGAAFVPALTLGVVAVATPAPLRIAAQRAVITRGQVVRLAFTAENTSDRTVRPSWFVGPRSLVVAGWRIVGGASRLAPGERSTYVAVPRNGSTPVQSRLTVYALSDSPAALSSAQVRLRPDQVTVTTPGATAAVRQSQRCAVTLLSGAASC